MLILYKKFDSVNKNFLKILFVCFLILLFIPLLHNIFGFFKVEKLHGAYIPAEKPLFSCENWFNMSFQTSAEKYLNENIGLKPFFVRLNNEIDYRIFKLSNAENLVIGKNSFLFEQNYIDAYTGVDYVGDEIILSFVEKYQNAYNILKDNNVELIFVFAPGKASFYPEYIPDRFLSSAELKTNYKELSNALANQGLNVLDFNDWFVSMKDTISYPLFAKAGIHWSYYGMYLCIDSIARKVESLLNIDLPEIKILEIQTDINQRHDDYDLGNLMNLLFKIPAYEMAYPVVGYEHNNKTRPEVLVIGDSFFWNMYYSGIPANIFKSLEFWYYNSKYYNDGTDIPANEVKNLHFETEVYTKDVVIIIQTEGGLNNFGFGFLNDVINNTSDIDLAPYIQRIRNSEDWMKHIREKAEENSLSVEEMLLIDARYVMETERN